MSTEATPEHTTRHEAHLLDRAAMLAMRAFIALQPAADLAPSGRTAFDALMAKTPSATDVAYESAQIGGISGWWCRPARTNAEAAILYLHGGAYVVGSAQAYRHFAGQIAARTGVDTFVADYGLAPERPFPAAVDDAEAAYRGLAGAGRSKIAVVGDSAGGGLALIISARLSAEARDGALPSPVAAAALSPWTDLALTGASIDSRASHEPLLTRATLEKARHLYLHSVDPNDPRASPLYGDLNGMPPVMLHVGEDEILLDDARRYAALLATAGSMAELHVWEGMLHVFPANIALLKAAHEALDLLGSFLRRYLIPQKTNGEKNMTRILFVGQNPDTVDFPDPSLPPGFDANKIKAGIAAGVAKIKERGWQVDTCMIAPDETAGPMIDAQLRGAHYDCVVIGGGLRIPPKGLVLFETVVNAIHKAAPHARIAFNTRPEDTAEAAARQVQAD